MDQATLMGIRWRSPSTTATSPLVRHSTTIPDAACGSSAPAARNP
ncbi:MAG TPA: hypothetical protein VKZ81_19660 [Pseudonocardia sp.]|nr:hypothetical protein [Pseudonocardia sp.]HLU57679.1 hypothetical protein [Pseudonocardia sp.]